MVIILLWKTHWVSRSVWTRPIESIERMKANSQNFYWKVGASLAVHQAPDEMSFEKSHWTGYSSWSHWISEQREWVISLTLLLLRADCPNFKPNALKNLSPSFKLILKSLTFVWLHIMRGQCSVNVVGNKAEFTCIVQVSWSKPDQEDANLLKTAIDDDILFMRLVLLPTCALMFSWVL